MTAGGSDKSVAVTRPSPAVSTGAENTVQSWARETFAESLVISAITGSTAAELSNTTSNLDAWVVLDDVSYPMNTPSVRQSYNHAARNIKALLMRKSEWSRLIRHLEKIDLSVHSQESISLESVMNSKRLYGNEQFDELITNEVRQTYAERLFDGQRDMSLSLFLDYLGALEDGEPALITELLQSLFRSELECLLIQKGDTYRKAKWLPKRLRRKSELAEKYYATYRNLLLRPEALGTPEWTDWVHEIWSCHQVVQWDILFGRREMVSLSNGDAVSGLQVPSHNRSSPLFILQINDRYFCKTVDRQFELSELAACLACQPKLRGSNGQIKLPPEVTTAQLEQAYGSLARSGLLRLQEQVS
ncbi:hypothetical protein [Tateyamaria sp. syn59]|uniref:hypothetical protein n=1 Tax=Tateyamaria sp. syn59 TaxID=2576942 RepID=UPI0011BFB4C1|nr:hypothetical protein [Tateyamaria sp. syn59]